MDVSNGELVAPDQIPAALTAHPFRYADGAEQTFEPSGSTTYAEGRRVTRGEWSVTDDGRFSSFWPPTYRAEYDLRWVVEGEVPVGLHFTELETYATFEGRYVQ